MIVKVDGKIPAERLAKLIERLKSEFNVQIQETIGEEYSILGLVGDTSSIDIEHILSLDHVADVQRIQEPYKEQVGKFKPENTIVDVIGDLEIGGYSSYDGWTMCS